MLQTTMVRKKFITKVYYVHAIYHHRLSFCQEFILFSVSILGKTALHWAAAVNNVNAMMILLSRGANKDAQDTKVRFRVQLEIKNICAISLTFVRTIYLCAIAIDL